MRRVRVYRSKNKVDTYLFVDAAEDLTRVPAELARHFGPAVQAMELELTADRTLAQVSAADVLAGIEDNGFFLQLPPAVDPVTGKGRAS